MQTKNPSSTHHPTSASNTGSPPENYTTFPLKASHPCWRFPRFFGGIPDAVVEVFEELEVLKLPPLGLRLDPPPPPPPNVKPITHTLGLCYTGASSSSDPNYPNPSHSKKQTHWHHHHRVPTQPNHLQWTSHSAFPGNVADPCTNNTKWHMKNVEVEEEEDTPQSYYCEPGNTQPCIAGGAIANTMPGVTEAIWVAKKQAELKVERCQERVKWGGDNSNWGAFKAPGLPSYLLKN